MYNIKLKDHLKPRYVDNLYGYKYYCVSSIGQIYLTLNVKTVWNSFGMEFAMK